MIVTANRLRSIGWIALLLLCGVLLMVLAFRVNSLRSQVHRAEIRIVSLKQEKMYLETEFETRANQQQLKAWNDVEFGYIAPTASQYLENERQLASLSMPAEPDAPAPIRVASMDDSVIAQAAFPAMVSPLTGKIVADEKPAPKEADDQPAKVDHATATATLGQKLATLHRDADEAPAKPKATAKVAKDGKLASKGKAPATPVKKTVEKVAAKTSAKTAVQPKANVAKLAKVPDSKADHAKADHAKAGQSHSGGLIKLALKDVKTKK